MATPVPSLRVTDAASLPAPSPGGTLFKQALSRIDGIQGPLSPALRPDARSGLGSSQWASAQQAQAKLMSTVGRMSGTHNARLAPKAAIELQELEFKATLAAKVLAKTSTTVKEVATAA